MLRRILITGAAFASSVLPPPPVKSSRLTPGVQAFVTHHHQSRQFQYSALVCQTTTTTSSHLSAEEERVGGRSEKGDRGGRGRGRGGRGGRGRGRNRDRRRSSERRPSSTSGGDNIKSADETAEETNKKQPALVGYRERWFQAHPNMNNGNNNRRHRRGGGRNNDRRGRRERTPPPPIPLPGQPGRHCHNSCISPGMKVYIVKKEDQRSGRETIGKVSRLLTNSKYHPRGIKVMLDGGIVGRVTRFVDDGNLSAATTNTTSTSNHINLHNGEGENVNDEALATLIGMDFDQEQARKALQMFDNDVERAVNYILKEK
jgi:uncharacterized repeat protein (TIGR03833 family)